MISVLETIDLLESLIKNSEVGATEARSPQQLVQSEEKCEQELRDA